MDHPKAKVAYAWAHESDAGGKRYMAVLGIGPVDSSCYERFRPLLLMSPWRESDT